MITIIENERNNQIKYRGIWTADIQNFDLFSKKFHEAGNDTPCTVCGRKTNLTIGVYVGAGGSSLVHPEDTEKADDGGFMGFFPIGNECIKKVPKEFRVIWEDLSDDKSGWRK